MSQFANRISRVQPSAIRRLFALAGDPSIVSFGGGFPDRQLFPINDLSGIFQDLLREGNSDSLQYAAAEGILPLREHIAARMREDGMQVEADDVLVLNGAQQGLDLVAKLLVNPGETIITENPTFLGALIAFNPMEPTYRAIEMDEEGMITDQLEAVLASDPTIKLIYTVPDFQNPTGVTMSLRRRQHLIDLAERYDVMVLEDSPYRALRYEGSDLPTLYSLDRSGKVIHLGSFSKVLTPGLRLGWVSARGEALEKLQLLKLASDTQCSTLNMRAVTAYLDRFSLDDHIAGMRSVYKRKRDLMLETIAAEFPATIAYSRPEGGLFTWITFPEGFDAERFMLEVAIPEAKVAYVPGGTFFPVEQRANYARMSFSGIPDRQIVESISRLGALLTQAL